MKRMKVKLKKYELIDVWIDDPAALQKDKLVFDPKMNVNNNNYNMFKGFSYQVGEAVVESESKF